MNWKPRGPWIRQPEIIQMLFETGAVRPGDFLWLHTPYYMESKIAIVIERPRPWAHGVNNVAVLGVSNMRRAYNYAEVKAWCRPPLDIEL